MLQRTQLPSSQNQSFFACKEQSKWKARSSRHNCQASRQLSGDHTLQNSLRSQLYVAVGVTFSKIRTVESLLHSKELLQCLIRSLLACKPIDRNYQSRLLGTMLKCSMVNVRCHLQFNHGILFSIIRTFFHQQKAIVSFFQGTKQQFQT